MSDQLSAKDWVDQGLKALARRGFTALKAEPLAKAMGVSRGSFYWHFADIAAFHAAILAHWREVAAEQIIAEVEAASKDENPLALLLRRRVRRTPDAGTGGPHLGQRRSRARGPPCRRSTGGGSAMSRACLTQSGLSAEAARARAQILYWAFLGFALSDQPLPKARQQAVLDELVRIATS